MGLPRYPNGAYAPLPSASMREVIVQEIGRDPAAVRELLELGSAATASDADFALSGHDHDGVYSALSHDHLGVYAPASHTHDGEDILDGTIAVEKIDNEQQWIDALTSIGAASAGQVLTKVGSNAVMADAAAGGGGDTLVMVQSLGSATSNVNNTDADIEWSTPNPEDPAITFSGTGLVDITFVSAGTYMMCVSARCTGNNNRAQLKIQGHLDTGSGYALQSRWYGDNYNYRDGDQNAGVTLMLHMHVPTANNKAKFVANCNADGTGAALTTIGTHIQIFGKTAA